ncbi:MAG: hypothetical protein PHQ23_02050 [Candidatus Wallbacteria bacterium]|nr:hypothetical protein [Candidatus Wallbacteria bacterium]
MVRNRIWKICLINGLFTGFIGYQFFLNANLDKLERYVLPEQILGFYSVLTSGLVTALFCLLNIRNRLLGTFLGGIFSVLNSVFMILVVMKGNDSFRTADDMMFWAWLFAFPIGCFSGYAITSIRRQYGIYPLNR